MTPPYPFSAVVGLDELRRALLVTAVSPAIGGVLVRGEKGTAKSTVVRALAALLPTVRVVPGCRFACAPDVPDANCPDGPHDPATAGVSRRAALVELPVGATEDRVTGTLDLRRALAEGVKAYDPGLLAAANRGVLYVDEVNLLPDHLVDLLLDSAAMGRAHVERDGMSVQHAARFLLVGTMNPEEGEPRPQLVDRFGLVVSVSAPQQAEPRAEVVRRRLAYEAAPGEFAASWAAADAALAERIALARRRLPGVKLPDRELHRIARTCLAYGVDGLRADIVMARAAVALAAWHGRDQVTADDVRDAARLALPHRRRRDPLDPHGTDEERLDDALRKADEGLPEPGDDEPPGDNDPDPDNPDDDSPPGGPPSGGPPSGGPPPQPTASSTESGTNRRDTPSSDEPSPAPMRDQRDAQDAQDGPGENGQNRRPTPTGTAYQPMMLRVAGRGGGGHAGRRSPAYARTGRVVGARRPDGQPVSLHLPASLRAAVLRGGRRITPADLREAVHLGREANLLLFVVDASGSMAARQRMVAVKTAVLSLLRDSYRRRDRVGMITFRGAGAELVLPPTSSHAVGVARLAELRTGGRTPIAAGLTTAARTLAVERRRDPRRRPLLVLVTDGRATSGPDPVTVAPLLAGTTSVVVDCETGPVRLGLAGRLATALGADCVPLDSLDPAAGRTGVPGVPGVPGVTTAAGIDAGRRLWRAA